MLIVYVCLFLLGIVLGSFFNVVGLRIPKNQSIVRTRSACPTCHQQLTPPELIPIFSYLIQKGMCKHCHQKISPIYPIMECLTGMLFSLTPFLIGWSGETIIVLSLISLFSIITVSDITYMIIPNKILVFFTVLFGGGRLIIPLDPWWDAFLGGAVGFLLLFVIIVINKGGMGGGDMKFFAVIGIVLGVERVLLSLFFACFIGAAIGTVGMAAGKIKRENPIPFGPFICIGTLIVYFFGEQIVAMYINFL